MTPRTETRFAPAGAEKPTISTYIMWLVQRVLQAEKSYRDRQMLLQMEEARLEDLGIARQAIDRAFYQGRGHSGT